jgi:hypothetical protein
MNDEVLSEDIRAKAKSILKGGIKYFNHTIMGKLAEDLEIFKSCRFANPIWMRDKFDDPDLPRDSQKQSVN